MKKIYLLFFLGLFCSIHSHIAAQDNGEGFSRRPAIRFGINTGGAWQCADVRAIPGAGLGATLEVPIVHNDHSLIGVSLRARYLWTVTFGRDWERSTGIANNPAVNGTYDPAVNYTGLGYIYANHRTSSTNWDLELMLTANRLRAKTGILAYIWGGFGGMGYRVKVDQYDDFFGTRHDWAAVSQDNKSEALRDISFEMDRRYETLAEETRRPRWVWAPSAGIGLGYEFTPWFSLAFEYKVTFPFTDLLDGQQWENDNTLSQKNDIHNYGGIGVFFGIGGGSGSTRPRPRPSTDPNVYTPKDPKPQIIGVYPNTQNTVLQGACDVNFEARLYNVRNKQLITMTVNGYTLNPADYSYNPGTGILSAYLSLDRGPNTIRVIAKNSSGTDSRTFNIECQGQVIINPPPPSGLPPEVYITSPTGCPAIIHDCRTIVYAEVFRVQGKADISVYLYGNLVSPQFWDFDPYSRVLTLDARLQAGDNRVEIVARNPYGQARASTVLRCPTQIVLPTVVITNPSVTPYVSANCDQVLMAKVTGVRSRNDITVYLNGTIQPANTWTWSAGSGILRMNLNLQPGIEACIEIVASNGNGRAADIQLIRCEQQLPPPIVDIINPPNGQYDGKDCNQRILAKVLNVSGAQDIRVAYNGQTVSTNLWSFDSFNQLLVMDVQLQPGATNQYTITATNTVGRDSESANLRCTEDVKMVSICHIPPGNPAGAATITIPEDTWPSHQAHGDVRGACSSTTIAACYQGQQYSIPQNLWPTFQGWGATQGPCPVEVITICHIPPRNPAAAATISIPKTDWSMHQAHGDIQGPCSKQSITVCLNGSQIQVPQNIWPVLQGQGATQGPCPVATISICHIPPGNPGAAATMTISESDWPSHQAHGDVRGVCSKQQMTVCVDGNQIQIPQNLWPSLQSQGATQGPCPQATITICHIPPKNPGGAATMTIAESDWPTHQAHGDIKAACSVRQIVVCLNGRQISIPENVWPAVQAQGGTKGPCPVPQITICHIPPNNPGRATTMSIPTTDWPTHQAHGDIKAACSDKTISVCLEGRQITIPANVWTFVQAQGGTQGPCPVSMISICHIPPRNPGAAATMTIAESDWPSHQAHGDIKAACSNKTMVVCLNGKEITIPQNAWPALQSQGATQGPCLTIANIKICHIPPGDPQGATTLTIPADQWPSHQSHGDVKGACSSTTVKVCIDGNEWTISQSALQMALNMGAVQGPCPPAQIQICHIPPKNPQGAATMSIPETDWPSHQAHGDVKGPCSASTVTGCLNGNQMTVSATAWPRLQSLGATKGPCPIPTIKICHIPPGQPENATTLEIPASEWPTHQQHGDVKGVCGANIQICMDGNNMNISSSAWPMAQQMGAVKGPCPVMVQICHIPPKNPAGAATMTINEREWSAHKAHGDIKTACSPTKITVCYNGKTMQVSQTIWPYLQSKGATEGACVQLIPICHFPPENPEEPVTIQVPANQLGAHLAHGDKTGACNYTPMTICHTDPGDPESRRTISIPTSAWPRHQQHGDEQGACPSKIKICHIPPGGMVFPTTMMINPDEWNSHVPHFDHKGECSHTMIDICHTPPGNPSGRTTINISQSSLRYHQNHGDVLGPCSDNGKGGNGGEGNGGKPGGATKGGTKTETSGGGKTTTGTVKGVKSGATKTGGKGAVKAAPKPATTGGKKITICHKPPSNPDKPETITIPLSQWAIHKKHGDTQGACPK